MKNQLLACILLGSALLGTAQAPAAKAYDADMCQYYLKRAAAYMKAGKMSAVSAEIAKAEQAKCPSNVRFY